VTPILAFDIETVPDLDAIRRLHDVPGDVDDAGVSAWFTQRQRARTRSDFAPLHLQKVVAIACALRESGNLRIWSIGEESDPEPELIRRFFDGIERFTPQLVSWNGSAFDLPVLHHRALLHGVAAARYWEWGDHDREFRGNSYLGRYHTRHLDLMDVLACYQPRGGAALDAMARLCGFPGKIGIGGAQVAGAVAAGRIAEVRAYCECDTLNTYLLYQRFRLMRGELDAGNYAREISIAREKVASSDAPHWKEFVAAWDATNAAAILPIRP
jgi:predicted PolB exonuclease-like 3'-5' exonuclease